MTNSSSTGGYLAQNGSPFPTPVDDATLDSFLQSLVSGITGLTTDFVRPRWQPIPPTQPPITTNWVAIGRQSIQSDTFPAVVHRETTTTGAAADVLQRMETFELACSFYGPNAEQYCTALRDGIFIAQNREQLFLNGMALQKVGEILNLSTLTNNQWYRRLDMIVYIVRNIIRVYPVLDLLSSSGTVETSTVSATWATANVKES